MKNGYRILSIIFVIMAVGFVAFSQISHAIYMLGLAIYLRIMAGETDERIY